jgi:hypothetical protein
MKAQSLSSALDGMRVTPDFEYTDVSDPKQIQFIHRALENGDVYFLDNRSNDGASFMGSFRVSGRVPELWDAESGKARSVSFRAMDGRTTIPLKLDPWGTVFVVFRKPTHERAKTVPEPVLAKLTDIQGPWTVHFQTGRGAPEEVKMDRLTSWTESAEQGVKYFSGEAAYEKTVEVPGQWAQRDATGLALHFRSMN